MVQEIAGRSLSRNEEINPTLGLLPGSIVQYEIATDQIGG